MMDNNLSLIRNFTIISHIDHGKSTLADRFLELTGTVPKEKIGEQYLDKMVLERERGITIKMHPCRMVWRPPNHSEIPNHKFRSVAIAMERRRQVPNKSQITNSKFQTSSLGFRNSDLGFSDSEYILNLIDTPGHVDFSYEVSRALAAVEGSVLLVDATKGIQAQTVANLELAKKENLTIIPAVNKIDLLQARESETKEELSELLSVPKDEILSISAKKGIGIEKVFFQIIEKISPPPADIEKPLKALIFDSKYDQFQGIVAYVRVFEGEIKKGDRIYFLSKKIEGEVKEIGYFLPELTARKRLSAGEIGYIKTGIKEPEKIRVGDTITRLKIKSEKLKIIDVKPLPGYKEPKPVIFTSIFPKEPSSFEDLRRGMEELHLSDPSFVFEEERKESLGIGFRCGFLGILHFEIILGRLKNEFLLSLLVARPTVLCKIIDRKNKEHLIYSTEDWLDPSEIKETRELWAEVEIITPQKYFNDIFRIFPLFKVNFLSSSNLGRDKLKIYARMPFRKLIENFYDKLKTVSQGFASLNFKVGDWERADLLKLDVLIFKKREPTMSKIIEKSETEKEAREIVEKLKEIFPPQLFSVPIQAVVGGKIIARENVKARRKDVTASLYGGDVTRKRKLLEKQKKGKKRLEKEGEIRVPNEVIIKLLKE